MTVPGRQWWQSSRPLRTADSLYEYFRATSNTTFVDYFDELLFPYYKAKHPEPTQERAIEIVSLHTIETYLRNNPKIGLIR